MNRSDVSRESGYVLLLIVFAAIVLWWAGAGAESVFSYQREKILAGQIWRIFTAPLVHLNGSHATMNLVALMVIWAMFASAYTEAGWSLITFVCMLAIGIGLLLLDSRISWYVGLSGLLHGYFLAGAISMQCFRKSVHITLLVLVCIKLLWEQTMGPLPGSVQASGGNVIVDAHLYGAVSGALIGWLLNHRTQTQKPPPND